MNKDDFVKLINVLVEKKVKEIVPKMIETEVKKQLESGIQPDFDDYAGDDDLKSLIRSPKMKNPIIRDNSQKKSSNIDERSYSKNPVINKILNDTAKDFTPLPKDPADTTGGGNYQRLLESEYENIGDEFSFNTKNMTSLVNRQPVQPKGAAQQNLKNQLLSEPDAKPEIVNAMVKDYSKMLKKMKKSADTTRGNGVPLGSGIGESW